LKQCQATVGYHEIGETIRSKFSSVIKVPNESIAAREGSEDLLFSCGLIFRGLDWPCCLAGTWQQFGIDKPSFFLEKE
jgi:hypothetical protein